MAYLMDTTTTQPQTREAWLQAFTAQAAQAFASQGYDLPTNVRVGVGFTSKGARGKAIGQCWSNECSADNTFEIFIVPSLDQAERVADVLTHELCHAQVGLAAGHGKAFGKVARAMGLEGKLTATTGGKAFKLWSDPILAFLGPYPHAKLTGRDSSVKKTQTTRMLKVACECGYQVRMTRKWLDDVGAPDCPACLVTMTCE